MTTDVGTALKELSERGITTLEQFVESTARIRKPQRIDLEQALEKIFARSAATSGAPARSKIQPPAPSVPIVLDGKRVEHAEMARRNGQPLDYVGATLKGGEPALVVFSDRSVMRNHHLRQFRSARQAIASEIETALLAGGLTPASMAPRFSFGLRIFEDVDYGGGSCVFAPEEYADDLTQYNDGLGLFSGKTWNDRISSLHMARCYCQAWEHTHEGGATLTLYEATPNLHALGWGDRISSIWAPFSNT